VLSSWSCLCIFPGFNLTAGWKSDYVPFASCNISTPVPRVSPNCRSTHEPALSSGCPLDLPFRLQSYFMPTSTFCLADPLGLCLLFYPGFPPCAKDSRTHSDIIRKGNQHKVERRQQQFPFPTPFSVGTCHIHK